MVVMTRTALIALNLAVLLIALRAVVNTTKLLQDGRAAARQRAAQDGRADVDPLSIFTPEEVDALSVSRSRKTVRATRLFGRTTPDPWAEGFAVQPHLLAVYANRLNDMVWIATAVSELLLLGTGAFAGVAAATYVADVESRGTGSTVPLATTLAVALVTIMFRVILAGEWRAAAGRYRELAREAASAGQTSAEQKPGRRWRWLRAPLRPGGRQL